MHDFPRELIGETFTDVLATVDHPCDIERTLTTLCLVCKAWRDVALATPRLWSNLGANMRGYIPLDASKVSRWFSRAGSTDKCLTIDYGWRCDHEDSEACCVDYESVIEFLTTGTPIRRLIIYTLKWSCFESVYVALMAKPKAAQGLPASWTHIKYIEFNSEKLERLPYYDREGVIIPKDPTVPRPVLVTLNLSREITQRDIDVISPMFTLFRTICVNLSNLSLPFVWPRTWNVKVLPLFTNLRTLELRVNVKDPELYPATVPFASPDGPLTLPHLRILRIHELQLDLGWDLQILRLFNTPPLEEFDVFFSSENDDFEDDPEGWDFRDNIGELVERSGCEGTLKRLRISNIHLSSDGLERMLLELPGLTHLTLDYVDLDSNFFLKPTLLKKEPSEFLPNLQVLELLHLENASFRYQDVCEFVSARVDGGVALRELNIELSALRKDRGEHPNGTKYPSGLRKRGVAVQINIGTHP